MSKVFGVHEKAPNTNWVSYTPVWTATTTNPSLGTTTTNSAQWRRVADSLEIQYTLVSPASGGSAGSGIYLFALPSGLVMDATKIGLIAATIVNPPSLSTSAGSGVGSYGAVGTASNFQISVLAYDTTHFTFQWGNGTATTANSIFSSTNYVFSTGGIDTITFTAKVPIVGWSANDSLRVLDDSKI